MSADVFNSRLGIALGNALGGYRDHDTSRAVEGLGEIVAIVRELEGRIASLEQRVERLQLLKDSGL